MIQNIKLRNFRNFSQLELSQLENKNFIVGENGKGKTNILEAVSLLCNNSVNSLGFEDLIKQGEDVFFIEYENQRGDSLAISYELSSKKKKYILNGKNTSKSKFKQISDKAVIFAPIMMNMMYLSPSLRRDFLDTILSNCYPEYDTIHKEYKTLLKHRNKTLKHIAEGKSQESEIAYWDQQFCNKAEAIYNYRWKLIAFLKKHIAPSKQYFGGKIENVSFDYSSKVSQSNTLDVMQEYLKKNLQRDIILGKTAIGPHVDDFDILVDGKSLVNYASRGETKSVIIWLKLLETAFTENNTGEKPTLIIDDLFSELDESHEEMLLEKIKHYQTFISSIHMPHDGNIITL